MKDEEKSRTIRVPELEGLVLSGEINVQQSRHLEEDEEDTRIPAVVIEGFGKLFLMRRRELRGKNPMTGEEVVIPSRVTVQFLADPSLIEKLNRS